MPIDEKVKKEILEYCDSHLADDGWYLNEFDFINDLKLRERLKKEFKAVRFAYKLYECINAQDENLLFEVRSQLLSYASIYEAVIHHVLFQYYNDTEEFENLVTHTIPIRINIPTEKHKALSRALKHDEKDIYTFYYDKRRKEEASIRFDDKCLTAERLGLIKKIVNDKGEEIDLPREIIQIYNYRNGIHLIAEQRKDIKYELELSKKAYWRMRPFIDQIKQKLILDGKWNGC